MFNQESFSAQKFIGIAMFVVVFLALSASRLDAECVEKSIDADNARAELTATTR